MEKLKIFAQTIEEEAVQQVKKMNACEAYKDCTVRIMPDCHAGKGCTIGTVIAVTDRVVPNTVGVDIGCGMLVTELGKQAVDLQQLDKAIYEHVPSGFNIHEQPISVNVDVMRMYCASTLDEDIAQRSIGTLGGGNHFIELDEDAAGRKYLVIHSGSRNLGVRVCNYYQRKLLSTARAKHTTSWILCSISKQRAGSARYKLYCEKQRRKPQRLTTSLHTWRVSCWSCTCTTWRSASSTHSITAR